MSDESGWKAGIE